MQDHKTQVRELSDAELDAVAAGGGHTARGAAGQRGLDIANAAAGEASVLPEQAADQAREALDV
jgi:hypothetical protein